MPETARHDGTTVASHVAFTVGRRSLYDDLPPGTLKIGRREAGDPEYPDGYGGGILFRSTEEAGRWIEGENMGGFSVYRVGLPAPFDKCVAPGVYNGRPYDALQVDCPILGPA